MAYQVDMDGETRTLFRHFHPEQKRKIKESLRTIARDPSIGKILQDHLAGLYSYRVGTTRIIYSIDRSKRIVHIITIGPRRTIYEYLERKLLTRNSQKSERSA